MFGVWTLQNAISGPRCVFRFRRTNDLVRAREDARNDLMAARHQLTKLLLRPGHLCSGGSLWGGEHECWLRYLQFDQ